MPVKTTREKWEGLSETADVCWVDIQDERGRYMDFYLLYHEHLSVFRKPRDDEDLSLYRDSMKR